MRRRKLHSSNGVVDPEAALSSVEGIQVAGAGAASTLDQPARQEPTMNPAQKMAQLEHQARILQQEIEALKRSNHSESDDSKGYVVNVAQREKFDSLAARAREIKTYRDPDPTEDVPPDYKQFESSSCAD
jgi:hypothetical protein